MCLVYSLLKLKCIMWLVLAKIMMTFMFLLFVQNFLQEWQNYIFEVIYQKQVSSMFSAATSKELKDHKSFIHLLIGSVVIKNIAIYIYMKRSYS